MDGPNDYAFLSTKPFKILGPQKAVYYAHGDLLARHSLVLASDVRGGMQETQQETIHIRDVDGDLDDDTVMRFIEFAYRSDYTIPDPEVVPPPVDSKGARPACPEDSTVLDEDIVRYVRINSNKKSVDAKKKFSQVPPFIRNGSGCPRPLFQPYTHHRNTDATWPDIDVVEPINEDRELRRRIGPSHNPTISTRQQRWNAFTSPAYTFARPVWKPITNNRKNQDFTCVFLCHARLYKFADRYGCEDLMQLTLQKLHSTLCSYIFHTERTSAVVELVKYVIAHTIDPDQKRDGLRELMLEYLPCYMQEMMQVPTFVELLQEGGSFPTELLAKMVEMIG